MPADEFARRRALASRRIQVNAEAFACVVCSAVSAGPHILLDLTEMDLGVLEICGDCLREVRWRDLQISVEANPHAGGEPPG